MAISVDADTLAALALPPIGRVGSPADADGDGIHDTCDACDTTPTGQFVGPDGCTMTPVPL